MSDEYPLKERIELFRKIRSGGPVIIEDDPYADRDWYIERWKRVLIAVRHDRYYDPVTPYPWVDDPGLANMDFPVATFDSGFSLGHYGAVHYWTEAHLVEDGDEVEPDQYFIVEQST